MLDIDFFKEINDQGGHLAGDAILIEIARALADGLRRVDIVARYGGDEFGIILPETSQKDALFLAERLSQRIGSLKPEYEGQQWDITASLGIASLGPAIQTPDDLIGHADQALYAAKNNGRNQVCSAASLRKTRARKTANKVR
jgi:diguanylate cyclase (GGDEF)-like protein